MTMAEMTDPGASAGIRYKLKFPSREALQAALAMEGTAARPVVVNEKRAYVSFDASARSLEGLAPEAKAGRAAESLSTLAHEFGARLVEDYRYQLDSTADGILMDAPESAEEGTLADVTDLVRAPEAWVVARGAGVTVAIVDTGVDGTHPEFPPAKRVGSWAAPGDDAWTDWEGHGTMCATIATASTARYTGIAPDAGLMSCKTHFFDSELGSIYDTLTALAGQGHRIVASNSFGQRTGAPPPPPADSDFLPALADAVAAGVIVVFSAGNNHQLAGGAPGACSPNSIWLHKSRADVIAVATCDLDRAMWFYSSRGPGQHFGDPGTERKPNVTAPTPKNGRILYGPAERVMANGWGTSGACPQVAGLAALLISADPALDFAGVTAAIFGNAVPFGNAAECEGSGLIDCAASLGSLAVS